MTRFETPPPPTRIPKLPFQLQQNEQVLLYAKRHWAYLTWQLIKIGAVALVPVIALLVLAGLTFGLGGNGGKIVWGLSLLWLLVGAIRGYLSWYQYEHDIWVVTDQRIIDSMKRNWFDHKMASADLDDVEDISIHKEGLWAAMFNFGHLQLQTAGARESFLLSGIPHPANVMALVDKQRDLAKRRLRGTA
jgi:hypothetical protein